MSRVIRRPDNAAVQQHNPSGYAPGAIRTATDQEAAAVRKFLADFPEFKGQPHDVILQHAALYRPEEEHDLREAMEDEGVPVDMHFRRDDTDGPTNWSDDA